MCRISEKVFFKEDIEMANIQQKMLKIRNHQVNAYQKPQ